MQEICPDLGAAAFVLKRSKGRGRIIRSFPEHSMEASAFCSKLLGLLAIRYILLAANKVKPNLRGCVHILSDFLMMAWC